mmetsp:Transcript_129742/g.361421  ORF Transcript_129742/g.361421 Transcript_129742/m.361421 type:complete len:716 (-) Transcript_129742:79-2226(-)
MDWFWNLVAPSPAPSPAASPTPATPDALPRSPAEEESLQQSLREAQRQKWLEMEGPRTQPAPFTGLLRSPREELPPTPDAEQRRGPAAQGWRPGPAAQAAVGLPMSGAGVPHEFARGAPREDDWEEHRGTDAPRLDGQPRPKKRVARRDLQAWEVDSDAGNDPSELQDEDSPWTPFMSREEAAAADKLESRQRGQSLDSSYAAPDTPETPEQSLESFEERVLGMKACSSMPKPRGAVASTADFKHDDTASGSDNERDAKDEAKKAGHGFFELPMAGDYWTTSSRSVFWTGTVSEGRISSSSIGIAIFEERHFADFDVEADITITKGNHAGLVFQCKGMSKGQYYALCINLADNKVEFRRSSDEAIVIASGLPLRHNERQQLRVRVADRTVTFFVNCRQVGHLICEGGGNRRGKSVRAKCALQESEAALQSSVDPQDFQSEPSYIGVWVSDSEARIRNIAVTNLQDYIEDLKQQDHEMRREVQEREEEARLLKASLLRRTRAVRLIQEYIRCRQNFTFQRMQLYRQAEGLGSEDQLRGKRLLTWFALLSVFEKFNEVMARPEMMERRNRHYLEELDRECLPPPPPPLQDPPTAADVELHNRYEERRRKYARQWEKAGRMVAGPEKFDKMKNTQRDGPADLQKRLIAQKCYERAKEVPSEKEHQELLVKAWQLENDWATFDNPETARHEFERWRDEKARGSSMQKPSQQRSKAVSRH